ncbi:MAG: nicotinamide mononucleotide transporter [Opitutaceae bacterium]|nr:nicotinamide mononucleotide transporter [Opitutaceae bacterium]
MTEIWRNIWSGFAGAPPLDRVNLALGVAGVVLMIRRSLWAFPVGLAAVTVQGVLFFRARFYADATQQAFFFAALAWGWWRWTAGRGAAPELPVAALPWRGRGVIAVGGVAATAAWAVALGRWTDAVMPWRDAFIAVFGIIAQWLQARKLIDNWPLWVVVNVVAIAAYWQAALAYTACLYAIYLGLAVFGWRAWARAKSGAGSPVKQP